MRIFRVLTLYYVCYVLSMTPTRLLFVTYCRRLNTHFRPIAAGSDYMLYPAFGWCRPVQLWDGSGRGGREDTPHAYGRLNLVLEPS